MEEIALWNAIVHSLTDLLTNHGPMVMVLVLVILGLVWAVKYLLKGNRIKDKRIEELTERLLTVIENNTKVLTELTSHINHNHPKNHDK